MPAASVDPRPGAAERLARMIALPTVSAELETVGREPFRAFEQLLAEEYPLVHAHLEREQPAEFGLLYRWRGRSGERPTVLMAHYDVVPARAGDGWTHDPFAGVIADGLVHGRGALDDKGPLLVVLEAVENLLAAGFAPDHDLYLSFGGNEESYGDAAPIASDLLHARGIRPWLVLDEGGAVVDAPLPWVPVQAAMVGAAEKGIMTVVLRADGVGGHASAPTGMTATARIARAVRRLERNPFRPRLPRSARDMLAGFATRTTGWPRLLLRVLAAVPWLTARVFARLGGEPAAMVRTTLAVTMLSGGTAPNVLPAGASATLNLRLAPGTTTDRVLRTLRRAIRDRAVRLEVPEASDPSPESPTDGPQFAAVRDAVAEAYPDAVTVPYLMMQATDARWFHRYAPATFRFAPLAMDAAQRASIHGVDERVSIDSLERGERFHRALITALQDRTGSGLG
ncbi:M20/M25/M40 family metallo-hydrolase [Agromyces sp. SYSU T00194]|uniref:M20/M25/M40 family metallo-hydrolase n=1 Tax=Agromyces chitinivorans TaxID=3158560 RepID=UPI003399886F